jgi:hypothetical protein
MTKVEHLSVNGVINVWKVIRPKVVRRIRYTTIVFIICSLLLVALPTAVLLLTNYINATWVSIILLFFFVLSIFTADALLRESTFADFDEFFSHVQMAVPEDLSKWEHSLLWQIAYSLPVNAQLEYTPSYRHVHWLFPDLVNFIARINAVYRFVVVLVFGVYLVILLFQIYPHTYTGMVWYMTMFGAFTGSVVLILDAILVFRLFFIKSRLYIINIQRLKDEITYTTTTKHVKK